MKERKYYFIAIVVLIYGCTTDEIFYNENAFEQVCQDGIASSDTVHLVLDEASSYRTTNIYYFEDGSKGFVARLNDANNSIYVHAWPDGNIERQLSWPTEGNGSPGKITGFSVENWPEILLYSKLSRRIYRTDTTLVLSEPVTIGLPKAADNYIPPIPVVNTQSPLYQHDGMYNLVGYVNGEYKIDDGDQRPVNLQVDKHRATVDLSVPYPKEVYLNKNWYGAHYRHVYYTYDTKRKRFLYSFPADHRVSVLDEGGNISHHYLGSKHIKGISSTEGHWIRNKSDRYNYFATNPSYSSIAYSRYTDRIYRFAQLPLPIDNVDSSPKPLSIIVYDGSFNCVEEILLDKPWYGHNKFVVTPSGLYLTTASISEDLLTLQKVAN